VAKTPTGPKQPINRIELGIVRKMQQCVRFPPCTTSKRFILDLSETSQLTDKGRHFLAFIAHRFRRQWYATDEEHNWIVQWNTPRAEKPAAETKQEQPKCQSSLAF
jgi:hypothetical protein